MFFFDINETSDEIIYELRHGAILFLAILCSFLLSLLYLFVLEIVHPLVAILLFILPNIVVFVFFIDFVKVSIEIHHQKKRGYVLQSSGHLISLENQWAITLRRK